MAGCTLILNLRLVLQGGCGELNSRYHVADIRTCIHLVSQLLIQDQPPSPLHHYDLKAQTDPAYGPEPGRIQLDVSVYHGYTVDKVG